MSQTNQIVNIVAWDTALFEWVNHDLSSPILDAILPWMREPLFWVPLYVFIVAYAFFNFGSRGYWFVVFLALTAGTADLVSSRVVKQSFQRLRPCNTEHLPVIERVYCGSGYSFTSSHAANHFAVATFLILTLGQKFRRIIPFLWIWAAVISFSQVYVGVHFPLDVIFGAILGMILGRLWSYLFQKYYRDILNLNTIQ